MGPNDVLGPFRIVLKQSVPSLARDEKEWRWERECECMCVCHPSIHPSIVDWLPLCNDEASANIKPKTAELHRPFSLLFAVEVYVCGPPFLSPLPLFLSPLLFFECRLFFPFVLRRTLEPITPITPIINIRPRFPSSPLAPFQSLLFYFSLSLIIIAEGFLSHPYSNRGFHSFSLSLSIIIVPLKHTPTRTQQKKKKAIVAHPFALPSPPVLCLPVHCPLARLL